MAARCSAAEATILRDIREKRLYEGVSKDFAEFCSDHLKSNKTSVNRIIRYLEEFGPSFFEIAQFTRITPATYRAIAPAVRDNTIHHNGDAIEIIPENAARVHAAVKEMQKTIPVKPEPKPVPEEDFIVRLDRYCNDAVRELEAAVDRRERAQQVRASLCYLRDRLNRIELTI